MRAGNLLSCAAALMNLRGHCNDGPGGYRKQVCALEAIALAAGIPRHKYWDSTPESRVAIAALAKFIGYPPPFGPEDSRHDENCSIVYAYNDNPKRTREEMISALLATSAILNAKESAENASYHLEMACSV